MLLLETYFLIVYRRLFTTHFQNEKREEQVCTYDQTTDVEIISEELDRKYKRINTMRKKEKLWGLEEEDTEKLNELLEDYNELYFILIEAVFTQQIEYFISNSEIEEIKEKLEEKYDWDGSILYNNDELTELMLKISSLHEFLNLVDDLMRKQLLAVNEFIQTELGKEIEDAFSQICSFEDKDINAISKYVITRNKVLKSIVETYFSPIEEE